MKTLHWYLVRQILGSLVMTVAVFTFILLLGNVLKEIMILLVNQQATLGSVVKVILYLIPYVLVFALPMGFLTATLLTFGRLSADQELTAIRASGVSLISLVAPIILLSILCSGLSALINFEIAPHCRMLYKQIIRETGMNKLTALLPEKTFIRDFKDYIVYIGEVKGTNLNDLYIYELNNTGALQSYVRAKSGQVAVDATNATLRVTLNDAWRIGMVGSGGLNPAWAKVLRRNVELKRSRDRSISLSDMTLTQLHEELDNMENIAGQAIPFTPGEDPSEGRKARKNKKRDPDPTTAVKIRIHRQVSFSFACIGFTLVGIPLGIRAHRRETTFGIAVALVLVLVYYLFFILGEILEGQPQVGPHLILWVPNILFQAVGAVLLWRANKGV